MRSRICQVALNTRDLRQTHSWYCRQLGMRAGGELRERGGTMLGGKTRPFDVWCLLTGQSGFQFEVFEFVERTGRPEKPCGCGYRNLRFLGRPGGCHVDPDGNTLEVVESGQNATAPILTGLTLGVPDVEEVRRILEQVLDYRPQGDDVRLELEPCRFPEHRPDRAIWNVALTTDTYEHYRTLVDRVFQAGYPMEFPPVFLEGQVHTAAFLVEPSLAVELLFVEPEGLASMGFLPGP